MADEFLEYDIPNSGTVKDNKLDAVMDLGGYAFGEYISYTYFALVTMVTLPCKSRIPCVGSQGVEKNEPILRSAT
jgi:hypothetical protein